MSKNVVVIAPHPDDETLGCGGTILKHIKSGDSVHWIIVTRMSTERFTETQRSRRSSEISEVANRYGFSSTTILNFNAAELNSVNLGDLIDELSQVFQRIRPEVVYSPFYGDVHTDHGWTFKAVLACTKSFRYSFIKRVLCYETISETEFGSVNGAAQFLPQVFVDVTDTFEKKMEIMKIYASEMGEFPYPRSAEAIKSLAQLRGSTAGVKNAESFQLIREIL
ncbi:PIG-L deacetylase family protein [Bdellovibrio bacteriovorus]|uniref:PIG-L deacetylase family protein n=1 Tax=Bdellovibrio bacteriovorus TaxID=959 RepID=UPI0005A237B8|nr:PIG-L deacetylase family protein [Bdellovibrio bacteriovorus]